MAGFSVPFTISDVYRGLAESEGILSFDGTCFEMQFQTSDSLVGLLKSDVKKLSFPLEQVAEVAFRKGFFSHKLSIRFADLETASIVPNAKSGEVELTVKRKHSIMALDLVAQAQLDLANFRLSRVTMDRDVMGDG